MWLVYVGGGWSGQTLVRDGSVEQSLALVGLGWWRTAAGQRWGAEPGSLLLPACPVRTLQTPYQEW